MLYLDTNVRARDVILMLELGMILMLELGMLY